MAETRHGTTALTLKADDLGWVTNSRLVTRSQPRRPTYWLLPRAIVAAVIARIGAKTARVRGAGCGAQKHKSLGICRGLDGSRLWGC